jgi:hypothetical protein
MLRRKSSNSNTDNQRESIGRLNPRQVSISDPAPVQMVTVAVLPPRLPSTPGGPRTGVPMADAFNWDEMINWTPSPAELERQQQKQRSKNPLKRGLTTARQKRNPDLPPFVMRQVPYETWRKHYAKDKDGNYKGTHAPAEDCLLRPHDVEKWKFKGDGGEGASGAEGWAGKFTRGKEALPVYGEVAEEGMVPGYEADYDPNEHSEGTKENNEDAREDYDRPPAGEPIQEEDEDEYEEVGGTQQQLSPSPPPPTALRQEEGLMRDPNSGLLYDAQREREELIARNKGAKGWKNTLKRGLEMASMGGN